MTDKPTYWKHPGFTDEDRKNIPPGSALYVRESQLADALMERHAMLSTIDRFLAGEGIPVTPESAEEFYRQGERLDSVPEKYRALFRVSLDVHTGQVPILAVATASVKLLPREPGREHTDPDDRCWEVE